MWAESLSANLDIFLNPEVALRWHYHSNSMEYPLLPSSPSAFCILKDVSASRVLVRM